MLWLRSQRVCDATDRRPQVFHLARSHPHSVGGLIDRSVVEPSVQADDAFWARLLQPTAKAVHEVVGVEGLLVPPVTVLVACLVNWKEHHVAGPAGPDASGVAARIAGEYRS
jgi:hypothetical protein